MEDNERESRFVSPRYPSHPSGGDPDPEVSRGQRGGEADRPSTPTRYNNIKFHVRMSAMVLHTDSEDRGGGYHQPQGSIFL